MSRLLLTCSVLLTVSVLSAQINFTDRSDLFFKNNVTSGVPMGIADMNGDLLDDIIQLDNTSDLVISFQGEKDSVFSGLDIGSPSTGYSNQWTMSIADIDNDGVNEILTGGVYDEVLLYRFDNVSSSYVSENLPSGADIFCQGSNLVDINNDGWLDIFICHDDAESYVWANNGNGTFRVANDWLDMSTTPLSDNSGNYGSVWTDFDNDGDQDLYISKCRQGAQEVTDPRRINMLMVNDGQANFTDEAAERNMAIGYQSWTADFQDIDNDGDLDCFVTNHDFVSQLLENDGCGFFTDITASSGINVTGLPIQGLLRDFDNDGYVDLLVSGTIQYLYRNNQDKTFTQIDPIFNDDDMESCSVGDMNNDGFLDILAGYAEVFNNPTFITDKLWLNEGNDNNYLKVQLTGVASNKTAVGTRLELYGPWGIQVREVRAGESYGISTAHQMIFGMADQTTAERLMIYWPSGNVDVIENPAANQLLQIEESVCFGTPGAISFQGNPVICPGQTLTLTAPSATSYRWSNGETTQSIEVGTKGNFWVVLENDMGCYARTASVAIEFNPFEEILLTRDGNNILCDGDQVTLRADTDLDFTWPDGSSSDEFVVTETGNYFVSAEGDCGIFNSDSIFISVLDFPEAPVLENDTIAVAGPAVLRSTGSLTHWFTDPSGGTAIATGNELQLNFVDQTTTYYAENANGDFTTPLNVGQFAPVGNSRYTSNQINGGLFFEVLEDMILQSVKVFTDLPGERLIEIRDLNDIVLISKTVNLEFGEQRVDLGFRIPVGNWFMTTNGSINETNFGFFTPRLERGNEDVFYPYQIDQLVQITGSNFGETRYYYFFDWIVSEEGTYCPSERLPAQVVLDPKTSTSTPTAPRGWTVFPNPADNILNVLTEKAEGDEIELALYAASGRQILVRKYQITNREFSTSLDISNIPNGVYQLKIRDGIEYKNRWVVVLR